jgi:hypothetical protein
LNLRDIDALVAEKVMGLEVTDKIVSAPGNGYDSYRMKNDQGGQYVHLCMDFWASACPKYSFRIDAAWQVLEKLDDPAIAKYESGWICTNLGSDFWHAAEMSAEEFAENFGKNSYIGFADTASKAICLAALSAFGIKVDLP